LCEEEIEQLCESVTFTLLVQGFRIERFEDIGFVLLGQGSNLVNYEEVFSDVTQREKLVNLTVTCHHYQVRFDLGASVAGELCSLGHKRTKESC
jgi:hypothetical protein